MKYFVMECEGVDPTISIMKEPDLGPPWYYGTKIEGSVPNPIEFGCEKDREEIGAPKHLYTDTAIPLMSDQLRKALTSAGVDNIEYFPAVLRDPKAKRKYSNYFAFNIIGAVAAADMRKSKLSGISDSVWISANFESLAIDPKVARGQLLFRLAQNLGAVIAHERVKKAVEKSDIPGMIFYEPEDWAG